MGAFCGILTGGISGKLRLGIKTLPIFLLLALARSFSSMTDFFLFSPRLPGVVFLVLSVDIDSSLCCWMSGGGA